MAMIKIPENLMPSILSLSGEGKSVDDIACWMLKEHGIQVTGNAIRKRIQAVRDERKLMSTVIIQDKLQKVLTADLDKVEGVIQRALEDELRSRAKAWGLTPNAASVDPQAKFGLKEGEVAAVVGSEQWSRLMNAVKGSRSDLMNALELRLKLAGADKNGNKGADSEAVRQQLIQKIDGLMEKYPTPKNQGGIADPVSGLVH